MSIVVSPLISLSRLGTIGQDEVEPHATTILFAVFEANELTNCLRLEPLVEDRGFIGKFKPDSASWIWANNL